MSPQLFTVNGTAQGIITLADTAGFKTKQVAYLTKSLTPALAVQVMRVLSPTMLIVGTVGSSPAQWKPLDISAYTVVSGASIGAQEQNKNNIPSDDHYTAIYESDPTVADRVIWVDKYGQFYDKDNPLPIAFDGTISVGNVTIQDDGGDELQINPDGSINVVIGTAGTGIVINASNDISSVASAVTTSLVTYTVPVGKTAALQKIDVSGENIAKYDVFVNGIRVDTKRTYFSGPINEVFDFRSFPASGLSLVAGDIVLVKVLHNRPYVANFEGRIQVVQFG